MQVVDVATGAVLQTFPGVSRGELKEGSSLKEASTGRARRRPATHRPAA